MTFPLANKEINELIRIADQVYEKYKIKGECRLPIGILISNANGDSFHESQLGYNDEHIMFHGEFTGRLKQSCLEAIRYFRDQPWSSRTALGLLDNKMVYAAVTRIYERGIMMACASYEPELVVRFLHEICYRGGLINLETANRLMNTTVVYDEEESYAIFKL